MTTFLAANCPFNITANYIYTIFQKIIQFLESSESKKSGVYKIKRDICELMRILGKLLMKKANNFIGINVEFLLRKLEILTRDRVLKVQLKAKEALKVWRALEKKLENLDQRKMHLQTDNDKIDEDLLLQQKFNPNGDDGLDDSLEKLSMKSRKSRSNGSNMDGLPSISSNNNLNSIQRGIDVYKKNNIVEKTYLKQKALNYQKKRSGTGGGYIDKIDKFSKRKKKPTYNTMRERLRQQVLQDKIDFSRLKKNRDQKKFEMIVKEKVGQAKRESEGLESRSKGRNESKIMV